MNITVTLVVQMIVFAIFVLVLLFKPTGLFARSERIG